MTKFKESYEIEDVLQWDMALSRMVLKEFSKTGKQIRVLELKGDSLLINVYQSETNDGFATSDPVETKLVTDAEVLLLYTRIIKNMSKNFEEGVILLLDHMGSLINEM